MTITLNNREEVIADREELNVIELLHLKKFTFPMIIVKINGDLIRKEDYPRAVIKNGDQVTALHLISGG